METIQSITLCHFDAMSVHLDHTARKQIKLRLETLRVDFLPPPMGPTTSRQCVRSSHECSEYMHRGRDKR